MGHRKLAFVLLSLIILYTTAFTAVIEPLHNHENTNQPHTLSSALSPSLSKSSAAPINTHNSQPKSHNHSPSTINMPIKNDQTETDTNTAQCSDTNQLCLTEPHKPRANTQSGNQYHIVEYHDITESYVSKHRTHASKTILNNANLLITTVDGKFQVLNAEHGSKQMTLDSFNQPLYQSPDIGYDNQIIPGIDGQLYLLRNNPSNEEYLEPLPFTIEQIAKNTGYADAFNTWYSVESKNTVFWIDMNEWNVCKPYGNIPDITDDNSDHIPLCNDAMIVSRIDREITAIDFNSNTPSTQWTFKHGEYRIATKYNNVKFMYDQQIHLQRFQLWQSLDNDSKYTLFLYDRDRGEIKWSKSLTSVVTNVKLLTADNQIFNFYVYHTKTTQHLIENNDIGLWIVPLDKSTQIAIAHSNRNPISNHLYLPSAESEKDGDVSDVLTEDIYDVDDDIKIIDENIDGDLSEILEDVGRMYGQKYNNEIKFVRLSFDGDLDTDFDIHSWQKTLEIDAQKYAKNSAMRIFHPTQRLLPMEYSNYSEYNMYNRNTNGMEYYGIYLFGVFGCFFMVGLVLYLISKRFRKKEEKNKREKGTGGDANVKVVGKFKYNVDIKLGEGRRGHVFVGTFENRQVAIKRIDRISSNVVDNEIDILLKVDHHPNIVRYYAKESDNEFDYIALDLCLCSLWDIIKYKNNTNSKYLGRKIPKIFGIYKPVVTYEILINSSSIHGTHGEHCACNDCRIDNKNKLKQNRLGNYYRPKNIIHNRHLTSHNWRNKSKPIEPKTSSINSYKGPPGLTHMKYKHLKRHKFVCKLVQNMCLEMIEGLIALHTAKDGCIIHRDIKPQNILIACENNKANNEIIYVCKLADMGIAKLMDPSKTSFDSENCGTLFWNAPELIYHNSLSNLDKINEENENLKSVFGESDIKEEDNDHEKIKLRLTKKVDIFSLGCVFSFLLTNGHHPYGDRLIDQHENMYKRKPNLNYCKHTMPAAYDLILSMIDINPKNRPEAIECKHHIFFWSDLKLITFLNIFSDYIEKCDKSNKLRVILELNSNKIIGNNWGLFVDYNLLNDAGKHRKYNFKSMRDYLRLIRNKWNHFHELPLDMKKKLCEKDNVNIKSASKFLHYFTQFTPDLVMFCYKLIGSQIKTSNEQQIKMFREYYKYISDDRIKLFNEQVIGNHRFRNWYNKH